MIVVIFTFEQEKKTHNLTNNHDVDDEEFLGSLLARHGRRADRTQSLLVFNNLKSF